MSEELLLDYDQKKSSRTAHNIFNLNIILVHLFGVVLLFELNLIPWLWLVPACSLSIMLFQYRHLKQLVSIKDTPNSPHWYIISNWALAVRHNRIVFTAYLITGSIFLIGYTLTNVFTTDPNMGKIGMMIFMYLSGNLLLAAIVVTFVLSSGAIWHINKAEMTGSLAKARKRIDLESE